MDNLKKINGNKHLMLVPTNESMIIIPNMITVVRAVFHKNNKYYPQVFLYELWII